MSDAPVIVVGAGLAGLACAQRLSRAGLEVVVLEAADGVGGRVRTDVVDGFRCDRGFQLLNPAYPVLDKVVDVASLDLRAFGAGVVVAHGSRRWTLADPRREPRLLPGTIAAPIGSIAEKLAFVAWALRSLTPVRAQLARPDRFLHADLDAAHLTGLLRTGVVDQFLAGVLAEREGSTSARLARLLIRSFLLGSPSVPSLGMERLPEALVGSLPEGTVRLGVRVVAAGPGHVDTDEGRVDAAAVVVATDPHASAALTGLPETPTRALTTFWHTTPEPPTLTRFLHLDADHRGPVVNSAVMTTVAPSYAPAGRTLVATTTLGADGSAQAERVARTHAGVIYGVDPSAWELITRHVVDAALPVQAPPLDVRQPVALPNGLFVAGDHRDTASIQGALVSGRRAATAVLSRLHGAGPETSRH